MAQLTFAEEQGLTQMPSQAELGTISPATSAALWRLVHLLITDTVHSSVEFTHSKVYNVLCGWWVEQKHKMIDEAPTSGRGWIAQIKDVFEIGFPNSYNFIQYSMQHGSIHYKFNASVERELVSTRAAYRVVERRIIPFCSEGEFEQVQSAIRNANSAGASGAKAHLFAASSELTKGNWGGSVHESISAVESAARFATGSHDKGLSDLLQALEQTGAIKHPALRLAIGKLYAFSSDAKGIRHSLVLDPKADITERDAFLLFGICAAFVSYILGPKS